MVRDWADDIEKMVEEVEKFKEEDEQVRKLQEARNKFENYLYQMKQTIEDDSPVKVETIMKDKRETYRSWRCSWCECLVKNMKRHNKNWSNLSTQLCKIL